MTELFDFFSLFVNPWAILGLATGTALGALTVIGVLELLIRLQERKK